MMRLKCCECHSEIGLPDELYEVAIRSSSVSFFCSYGHKQNFSDTGIRQYWAAKQLKQQQYPDMTNVVQFKGKIHEAKLNS